LLVDDDTQLRQYTAQLFSEKYEIYEAESGEDALRLAAQNTPDLVITDVSMKTMSGIELTQRIKETPALSHIPVILLTGASAKETKLKGVELGADDYITKPFEKEFLLARVESILRNRSVLQNYFYNEITLQKNTLKISPEYKEFLDNCIRIVEQHLDDDQFSIQTLAAEIGMSHSSLYKRVKSISGQSVNAFIRFIRLRKAAELFITTDSNVNQVSIEVGVNDSKYFRSQFNKLFGMNPSEYIKKFRKPFNKSFTLSDKMVKQKER
jgi:YesN/AraC family two-component response regulator